MKLRGIQMSQTHNFHLGHVHKILTQKKVPKKFLLVILKIKMEMKILQYLYGSIIYFLPVNTNVQKSYQLVT